MLLNTPSYLGVSHPRFFKCGLEATVGGKRKGKTGVWNLLSSTSASLPSPPSPVQQVRKSGVFLSSPHSSILPPVLVKPWTWLDGKGIAIPREEFWDLTRAG